jgi:hypothetical protein
LNSHPRSGGRISAQLAPLFLGPLRTLSGPFANRLKSKGAILRSDCTVLAAVSAVNLGGGVAIFATLVMSSADSSMPRLRVQRLVRPFPTG